MSDEQTEQPHLSNTLFPQPLPEELTQAQWNELLKIGKQTQGQLRLISPQDQQHTYRSFILPLDYYMTKSIEAVANEARIPTGKPGSNGEPGYSYNSQRILDMLQLRIDGEYRAMQDPDDSTPSRVTVNTLIVLEAMKKSLLEGDPRQPSSKHTSVFQDDFLPSEWVHNLVKEADSKTHGQVVALGTFHLPAPKRVVSPAELERERMYERGANIEPNSLDI